MREVEAFSEELLQRICDVLAHPTTGLTGSEIGTYLLRLHIADPGPGVTRRTRLFEALRGRQAKDRSGDCVVQFLQATLDPARYGGNLPVFEGRRRDINDVLAPVGLELLGDGRLHALSPASQAASGEAARLQAAQLAQPLAAKIRDLSGLAGDGLDLAERAFGIRGVGRLPLVAFNQRRSEAERLENAGLVALLKGFFAACHDLLPSAEDLSDLAALAALLSRRLGTAHRLRTPESRIQGATHRQEPPELEP
jgi:hypothetical protein